MRLVRTPLLLTVYAIVAGYLAALHFLHYPVVGFFARAGQTAFAAGALLLAASFGRRLSRWTGFAPWHGPVLEEFLWCLGLGLPALALGTLALGLAGALRPGALLAAAAAVAALSAKDLLFWAAAARNTLSVRPRAEGFGLLLAVLGAAAGGVALLCAFAPPTYYDSLVYHLALPAKYLQEGRVAFVPYNHYSHFPQNMELVFSWFLAGGSDVAAQVFNVLLAGALAAALWQAGRTTFGLTGRRWDLLIFLTAPCVTLLSSETYVEAPLAFWTWLAVWAGLRALSAGETRWWVMSGLMAGFAAGVKYTAVLTPAVLLVMLLAGSGTWREKGRNALALFLPAFLLFLPWMAKNYVYTGGNPVFPFLPGLFPAKNVYLHAEAASAYFRVLDEYRGTSSLLIELFLMPFRLVSNAVSFGGGYDVTGDLGWALPLLLLPLAFLAAERGPRRALLIYALGHGLIWASMRPVLRFLYPAFPAFCLLAGLGLDATLREAGPRVRRAAGAVLALFVLSNASLFYLVERVRDPFPAAWGTWTRDEYLRRKIDAYPALEFVNRELPPDSRLLLIGDQRGYYCARPYVAPMALLPTPLREWSDGAADAEALRAKLVESGFTHLFFHRREAERLKSYRVLDLTEKGMRNWTDMLARLPKTYDTDIVSIYELRRPGA